MRPSARSFVTWFAALALVAGVAGAVLHTHVAIEAGSPAAHAAPPASGSAGCAACALAHGTSALTRGLSASPGMPVEGPPIAAGVSPPAGAPAGAGWLARAPPSLSPTTV